ncbi:hypothetical protein [Microbacterium thalassium]|uniref:Uncharacterized protein n=1 Tax=Microbacterium thalassium TaxID=362649 RepID=A0A7X0KTI8_9MICO|nr:hypothetical protein [Microbacterium thalassium]MBB6390139.1 hypothetical protein [Microbacterium thalassium]GLK25247.1 hypothetical protein GCM10017607_25660 [Microbacterium thalassium]
MRERPSTLLARAVATVAVAGIALVALSGCGDSAETVEEATPTTVDELCAIELVVDCSQGPSSLVVEVAGATTDEEVLEFAADVRAVAAATPSVTTATLELEGPPASQLDGEVTAPPKWLIEVYPADHDELTALLAKVFEVAAVPGTTGISLDGEWPTVTVLDMSDLEWVFTTVRELPLFADGGTYTLLAADDRLTIVHVPARMSDEAVREVIRIALEHPESRVLLEAATESPHNPTLYVSGLTADAVAELDERLSDPRLADADVDGYPVSYVLSSDGEDGTEFTSGTFGGVGTD